MRKITLPRPLSQFLYLLMVCLFCLSSLQAQAQTSVTPQPRGSGQAASAKSGSGPCLIAEFRLIALTTHDPLERQNKSIEWLQQNNANCSLVQLSILHSSKAALMGTSDSTVLSAAFDTIMEKRLANNPEALSRYYRPETQGLAPSKAESASTGASAGPAKPALGGAPALAAPAAAMPGALGPSATASQNISMNVAGSKPTEEDMSRKMPLPTEPLFVFAPEFGAPMLNYFGKIRRQFARTFFMETLSPGKCPEGMTWRTDKCEATIKVAWRFGEKVPQGAKTFPVEPTLIEKLNFDPGYTFVRIGGDILALERDTGKIADAIMNLGKAT